MTRQILARFIDQVGITDASIMLHRGPHKLERWRDGQEDIPLIEKAWLTECADRFWREPYSPEQQARIEAMANSKGVELDEWTAAELWEIAAKCCST